MPERLFKENNREKKTNACKIKSQKFWKRREKKILVKKSKSGGDGDDDWDENLIVSMAILEDVKSLTEG